MGRSNKIVFKIPAKVYPDSNAEVIDLKRMLRHSDRKVEELQKSLAEVQKKLETSEFFSAIVCIIFFIIIIIIIIRVINIFISFF